MTEVLATKLKNDTARLFFDNISNNDLYVLVSSVTSGTNRDRATNSQKSRNAFLENTLFGKKIRPEDLRYMIKYYPWQKDSVYTQYDDNIDMEGKNFYAVVTPDTSAGTGDYRIFKCLYNADDSPSLTPPSWEPDIENQIYRQADGYVWKFMYAIDPAKFEAFNAIGYIPLEGDFDVNPDASDVDSPLSDIFVENPIDNAGYPSLSGTIATVPNITNEISIRGTDIVQIDNYYTGMSIYVENAEGVSSLYDIISYTFNQATQLGVVVTDGTPYLDNITKDASTYTISPKVVITGDGTGAKAIASINAENKVKSITIIEYGTGYTNCTAEIKDPIYNFQPDNNETLDIRVKLRVILAPPGGHASNLIEEFYCRHILMYGYITESDNNEIGATNSYSYVGVVKDPEFTANTSPTVFDNRLSFTTPNSNLITVNENLTQVDADGKIAFTGKVHEVNLTTDTVYLSEYMGPYPNVINSDIAFNANNALYNTQNQLIQINNDSFSKSEYVQRSGQVYFMEDFIPLLRTTKSREEYKLVLEF
jgi:hypothetical protein